MTMSRQQLYDDPEIALRTALEGLQSGIWTSMPAIVESYDPTLNVVRAQIAIMAPITDEFGVKRYTPITVLPYLPVIFPAAGGFLLTMPIQPGDEIKVFFASRCIDSWWQSGGVQLPIEDRMHDLSDGFAFAGIFSKQKAQALGAISTTEAQLRTADGATYVAITADGKIKLAGDLIFTGNLSVAGNFSVSGNLSADGEVVAHAAVPATAVHLSTHVHTSAAPGNPTTPPTPGS